MNDPPEKFRQLFLKKLVEKCLKFWRKNWEEHLEEFLKKCPSQKNASFEDTFGVIIEDTPGVTSRLQNGESIRKTLNIVLVLTSSYLLLPRVKRWQNQPAKSCVLSW